MSVFSRLAAAALAGVMALIACLILGQLPHFDVLVTYAWIIGLLVGVVYYFSHPAKLL